MGIKLDTRATQTLRIEYGEGEARAAFTVQPLQEQDEKELRQKCFTITDKGTKLDLAQLGRERMNRLVVDWDGIEDESGKPLACTYDNKVRLFMQTDIIEWLFVKVAELASADRAAVETETKN